MIERGLSVELQREGENIQLKITLLGLTTFRCLYCLVLTVKRSAQIMSEGGRGVDDGCVSGGGGSVYFRSGDGR